MLEGIISKILSILGSGLKHIATRTATITSYLISYVHTLQTKIQDFLQTTKVFPTNFISVIMSANNTQKVVFVLVKRKTTKVFPT